MSGYYKTAIILAAAAACILAVVKLHTYGEKGSGLGQAYDYDLESLARIDPNLVIYRSRPPLIETGFQAGRAIAVSPDGLIWTAGDQALKKFDANGLLLNKIELSGSPTCLCVTEEKLYVGMRDHLEVYDHSGKKTASWEPSGDRAVFTAVDVYKDDVFVADAGNRVVIRYDTSGKLVNYIGRRDKDRGIAGFVVPSPYFDLAVAGDGLLRVVNPGMHRIEAYTFQGDLEFFWGEFSSGIEGFIGCCNPVNLALLEDDGVITCEKGIIRVKLYGPMGDFKGVVAGPGQFGGEETSRACVFSEQCQSGGFDVVAGKNRLVYVFDTRNNVVRTFEPLEPNGG